MKIATFCLICFLFMSAVNAKNDLRKKQHLLQPLSSSQRKQQIGSMSLPLVKNHDTRTLKEKKDFESLPRFAELPSRLRRRRDEQYQVLEETQNPLHDQQPDEDGLGALDGGELVARAEKLQEAASAASASVTEVLAQRRRHDIAGSVKEMGKAWAEAGVLLGLDALLPGLGTGIGYVRSAQGMVTALQTFKESTADNTYDIASTAILEIAGAAGADIHWSIGTVISTGTQVRAVVNVLREKPRDRKTKKIKEAMGIVFASSVLMADLTSMRSYCEGLRERDPEHADRALEFLQDGIGSLEALEDSIDSYSESPEVGLLMGGPYSDEA